MKIRSAYSEREETGLCFEGQKTRTKQSFKDECNINNIMKRFEKTGVLEHTAVFQGNYGDFTTIPENYHEAVNQVIIGKDMFMTLPASIRKRFDNDPGLFLDFVSDPDNAEEMQELGLVPKQEQLAEIQTKVETGEKPKKEMVPEAAQDPVQEK